jgi:hypothetical protein
MSTKNTKTVKNAIVPKIVKSLKIVTDKKTGENHLIEENSGKILSENWTNYIRKEYAKCKIFTLNVNDAETQIQRIHKNSAIPLVRLRGTFRHDLTDLKYQNVDSNGIPLYIKEKESNKATKEKEKATKTEKNEVKKTIPETKKEVKKTVKKVTAYCPDDDLNGIPSEILEEMKAEGLTV